MYHHPSCEECREGRRSIDVNHTSQLESFICSGSVSGFRIPDSRFPGFPYAREQAQIHAGTIVQNQNGGTGLFTFCEFIMCFLVLLFCHQLNGIYIFFNTSKTLPKEACQHFYSWISGIKLIYF